LAPFRRHTADGVARKVALAEVSVSEGEAIDLHDFRRVDVAFVPFDDLTVLHRHRLDPRRS
jgi:hypothetical protein